jgi:hypothetical protein
MAASQLLLTNGATPATPAAGKTILFINASKQLATVDDAGLAAVFLGGSANYQATPTNPTGTTNTTGLMMGLAGTITPATSGSCLSSRATYRTRARRLATEPRRRFATARVAHPRTPEP